MADNSSWYYAAGGSQRGPVTRDQMSALVAAGAVTGETLVWAQGMADWTALARTDLSSLLRLAQPPAPPPMPPRAPEPPAPQPSAPQPSVVERVQPAPQPAPTWSAGPSPGPQGGHGAQAGYAGRPDERGYAGQAAGPGGPQYGGAAHGGPAYSGQAHGGQAYGAQPPGYVPALSPMGMGGAIAACFRKYATFEGRSRRAEFWYFYLFMMVIHVVLLAAASSTVQQGDVSTYYTIISVDGIVALIFLLPMISVTVRRLHDTDRSGWWWWIQLVPVVGVILLIVFAAERGTTGPNRYGPPPV